MPSVEITNSNGPARVNYTISTPTNPSAPSIDPSLPTIFFIHPVYIAQQIFHRESLEARYVNVLDSGTNVLFYFLFRSAVQFSNTSLRRFNLVAMDARLHGDTVGPIPKDYNRTDAARDIASLMVGAFHSYASCSISNVLKLLSLSCVERTATSTMSYSRSVDGRMCGSVTRYGLPGARPVSSYALTSTTTRGVF